MNRINKINNYLRLIQEGDNKIIIGKHNDIPNEKFDSKELKMGIKVEYEHTDLHAVATAIAKDHLSELPDYYTRLKKMEDEGFEELGIN